MKFKYFLDCLKCKEHIQLIFLWLSVLFISISCVLYLNLRFIASAFERQVTLNQEMVMLDLHKIYESYLKQLTFVKYEIEAVNADPKMIQKFFDSKKTVIIDRNNIATIIITDNQFNIIYADGFGVSEDFVKLKYLERDYKDKISSAPDSLVIGNAVIGVITQKYAIPIVTGIKNKSDRFAGAIIFSIPLSSIVNNLSNADLRQISFVSEADLSDQVLDNYQILLKAPVRFLFNSIINTNDKLVHFGFKNSLGNNVVQLSYGTQEIVDGLLNNCLIQSFLVFLLLIILGGIFAKIVIIPLLPTILAINKLEKQNPALVSINGFQRIGRLYKEYHLQQDQIRALTECCVFIANRVNSKVDLLTSNIEEMLLGNKNYNELAGSYKEILSEIYKFSVDNRYAVKSIVHVMQDAISEIKSSKRELVNIIDVLNDIGIEKQSIKLSDNNHYSDFMGLFFKPILIIALRNILSYINMQGNVVETYCDYDEFKINISFRCSCDIQNHADSNEIYLIKSRTLSLINSTSINLYYSNDMLFVNISIKGLLECLVA